MLHLHASVYAFVILLLIAPLSARAEDTMTLSAAYRGDLWRNVDGGLQRGGRYFDDILVNSTIDMDKALGLSGGTVSVTLLHNNGAHFSDSFVGATQVISNTEAYSHFKVFEAWYEQRIFSDRVSFRAGLYDLNTEFDSIDAGALFINSSHGIGTDFSQSGQAGPSIFPVTSLAARVQWQISPDILLRAAVLDGVPGDPAHPKRTAIKLGDGDGALLVGEVEGQILGATVALGAWGYTAAFDDLVALDPLTGTPRRRSDNRGAYIGAERRLFGAEDGSEGLTVYARFGVAEGAINMFSSYLGAGVVYDGIVPDTAVGFAVASARTGKSYRAAQAALGLPFEKRETIFEATVHRQLTPWLGLQPDVQYVVNPSAAPGTRNAVVLGLRFEIAGAMAF